MLSAFYGSNKNVFCEQSHTCMKEKHTLTKDMILKIRNVYESSILILYNLRFHSYL